MLSRFSDFPRPSRLHRLFLLPVLLALALAGCGGDDGGSNAIAVSASPPQSEVLSEKTAGTASAAASRLPKSVAEGGQFQVFNTMQYLDMPNIGNRLPVIPEKAFFPIGSILDDGRPSGSGIANAVRHGETLSASGQTQVPLEVLEIARWRLWPWVTGPLHEESVLRYRDTARAFGAASGKPLCFNNVAPAGGFVHMALAAGNATIRAQMQVANDAIGRELIPAVDALCPQLYTYYDAPNGIRHQQYIEQWKQSARETIAQARRIAGGKPVYAFLWPQFHRSGIYTDLRYLPADYWRAQLELVKELADGIILWGGVANANGARAQWDDKAEWVRVFREVIGDNAVGQAAPAPAPAVPAPEVPLDPPVIDIPPVVEAPVVEAPVVHVPPPSTPAPTAPTPAPAPASFKVFNAMLYANMPRIGNRVPTVYEQAFFPKGEVASNGRPTAAGIANAVHNAEEQFSGAWQADGPLVLLDIERWQLWPWVTGAAHNESAARYRDAARAFRQQSGRPVCYYNIAPFGGIVHSTLAATNPAVRADWNAANDVIGREVVPTVDALCPQLYTYYDSASPVDHRRFIEQWKLFARQTIAQARRISGGKPVYPFIWPQFHQGGMFKDARWVPMDYWRAQLEVLKEEADGVILWGGWNFTTNRQLPWDPNAQWYKVFKEVIGQP